MEQILEMLSQVLKDFCDTHEIPRMSADDILHQKDRSVLSKEQAQWLQDYVCLWDATQALIK